MLLFKASAKYEYKVFLNWHSLAIYKCYDPLSLSTNSNKVHIQTFLPVPFLVC